MKKLTVTTLFLLSTLCSAPLLANQNTSNTGGFTGPGAAAPGTQNLNSVRGILNSGRSVEEMQVTLTGKITQSLGGEKYMFSDGTAEIVVEIDQEDWYGLKTTPETLVIINAEVDHDAGRPTLDVQRILAK